MTRLENLPTLRIQSDTARSFTYRNRTMKGVAGDTVATALFANGVRIFGRSLKYHRPRGLYSLDGECSNTMMQVDGVPNVQAETTLLTEGMAINPQNVKGSPEFDFMRLMDGLSWAMPAGFYYRMFHRPAWLWPKAIKEIRKAAGLGVLSPDFRMDGHFDEIHPRAEVCVIGGGLAGMSAALEAARQGLRVVLLESRPWLGGAFEYRVRKDEADAPYFSRARALAEVVEQAENIRVFTHAPAIGVYSDGLVTGFQKGALNDGFTERYLEVRADSVVTATGCLERPLLFDNNERPGVMQVGCAHRLARTWGLLPGKTAVFSIGQDPGLEAAIDLFDLGLEIACVADIREDGQDPLLIDELGKRGIPFLRGWVAQKAHGFGRVAKVTLASGNGRFRKTIPADTLVASAGFTPATGPLALAHAKLEFDVHTGFFLPSSLPRRVHAAGRMLGLETPESIETSGKAAGLEAAGNCGVDVGHLLAKTRNYLESRTLRTRGSKFVIAPGTGRKTFICFDEDTTVKNVDQAMAKGFDVPELIKRFTSAGTGPGQGGIPGHNLPLYVGASGKSPDPAPRPTTVRPPLVPTLLATYAGTQHDMCKRTPVHDLQVQDGGRIPAGTGRRANGARGGVEARKTVFGGCPMPGGDLERSDQRRHAGCFDSGQISDLRAGRPEGSPARLRRGHEPNAGRQGQVFRHVQR